MSRLLLVHLLQTDVDCCCPFGIKCLSHFLFVVYFGMTIIHADDGDTNDKALIRLLEGELAHAQEKIKQQKQQLRASYDEFFIFTTSRVTLGPNNPSATIKIPLTREADFEVTKIIKTGEGFTLQVRDSGNDRNWFSAAIDAEVVGDGLEISKPRFVARASTLTVELQDTSPLTCGLGTGWDHDVSISFAGYKQYVIENLYHATGPNPTP
jgi:hypothetical protein